MKSNKTIRRRLQEAIAHAERVARNNPRYAVRLRAEGRAKGLSLALYLLNRPYGDRRPLPVGKESSL